MPDEGEHLVSGQGEFHGTADDHGRHRSEWDVRPRRALAPESAAEKMRNHPDICFRQSKKPHELPLHP